MVFLRVEQYAWNTNLSISADRCNLATQCNLSLIYFLKLHFYELLTAYKIEKLMLRYIIQFYVEIVVVTTIHVP